nr:hypothetical protein BaRGS_007838 [Batillaria attramentaria]
MSKSRPAPPKPEHGISQLEYMNTKIERLMREEQMEESQQQHTANEESYMASSSGSRLQPATIAKKRIMHRPRFRDDPPGPATCSGEKFSHPASSTRDHPRSGAPLPSTTTKTGAAADTARSGSAAKPATSGSISSGTASKEKKSDLYDFPDDSPDEDSNGRKPSSYMALGTPGRSPRKGHVDSSDSSKGPGSSEGRADTSGVGSSIDERRASGDQSSGGKDGNEAQAYESYGAPGGGGHHHHQHRDFPGRDDGRGHYRDGGDADVSSGSNTGVDSTHSDTKTSSSVDDSADTIDSSTMGDRKSSKRMSPRRAPDDGSGDTGGYDGGEAQGRNLEGLGYVQHSRSPRGRTSSTESGATTGGGYSGADSSSTDRSPMGSGPGGPQGAAPSSLSMGYSYSSGSGSGQPVVSSMMRDTEHQPICSRDQEPAPLLSAQYETLSDDDDN